MDSILGVNNILENVVENGLNKIQNNFIEETFGNVVNNAIDMALKAILPDMVENQVINVKDAIMQDGVKAGIDEAISNSIELGKSVIGVFTGNFENISQLQNAVKKGGVIDAISSVIDKGIDFAVDAGLLDKKIGKVITSAKKTIFKNINNDIENNLNNQMVSVEKLDKYCEKWNDAYLNQDINSMTKSYNKINKELENIIPLENTIKKAREIENLQKIIENNGGDFNISSNTLELAKVL